MPKKKKPISKMEARRRIISSIGSLRGELGRKFPVVELFTDLDDHPKEDDDAAANHVIGYVLGLVDAFGFDINALCREVDGAWGAHPACETEK